MIARALDAVVILLTAALLLIAATGGIDAELGPFRVRLHDWTRPLALLVVAIATRAWLARRAPVAPVAPNAPIAAVVTRGMVALLLAVAGVYAHSHIRIAGGLDSYGYVSTAHLLASGRLSEAQPLAAVLPFDNPMSAAAPLGHVPSTDGRTSVPRFPLGLPVVMAIFTMFGSSGPFFVPLLMAYGAIVLAYLLGRDAGSAGTISHAPGLFAAGLVAVDPLFAAYAIQPMSDVPATGWLLASVWAATTKTRVATRPLLWSLVAGICGGMAILTRPALLPAVIVLVLVTAGRRSSLLFIFGGTVAAFVALQLALNVALYGGPSASGYGSLSHMFELSLPRLIANAANFGKWLTYSHTALFWLLWPGALFVLRRQPSAWHLSAVAAAAAVPYLFYIVFDDWESSRFLIPSIALILILCARAFAHLSHPSPFSHPSYASHLFMLAIALVCAAASHRFLEREGLYRLHTLEDKYALVGEWFKANTSERGVVLAGLHSGAIRLYGQRATIRWDQIPGQALTATLSALIEAGYEPYLALDLPSEPPLFDERFRRQPLHAEQIARVRVVNIYRFVSAH